MICDEDPNQLSLAGFETFFQRELDKDNRWVKLSRSAPWDKLSEAYYRNLSQDQGRPAKKGRLVIGAVIIKHKLSLSDEETVQQIQENPYLQHFVGFSGFRKEQPFAPSLFVEIRKRMGAEVFERFEQAIRFPTDLDLLNESREISEKIIDELYPGSGLEKKPRTYRKTARKRYLAVVKQRKPGKKKLRRGIKEQLQYLRRNLGRIEMLLDKIPGAIPLPHKLLRKHWIIQHVWRQQDEMYRAMVKSCSDRIVSIHQPHVRPIVRGKADRKAEFGAKLGVSLTGEGIACVDTVSWDAYHEGADLQGEVESYKERHGYYPEMALADNIYGTRDNRRYLKTRGIRYGGKPLGRPKQVAGASRSEVLIEKKRRREEYRQRIPIEGKFGQGKNGYRLNYIRAKTSATSEAWIRSIFLVMNLLVLAKSFIFRFRRWFGSPLSALLSALRTPIICKPAIQPLQGS